MGLLSLLGDIFVTVKCGETLSGNTVKEFDYGFFKIRLEFSKCPINSTPRRATAFLLTNKGSMSLTDFLNKNGKFGPKCREEIVNFTPSYNSHAYFDNNKEKITIKPELCAMDKTLTLAKIKKEIENQKSIYTRDLKNHIVYSY